MQKRLLQARTLQRFKLSRSHVFKRFKILDVLLAYLAYYYDLRA